jgi:hypothetical protein
MRMAIRTVDLLHAIFISVVRASRPWQTGARTVEFELRFLPYGWAHSDENPCRPDGWINLPLFELGKKIWSWLNIESHPDGLLKRPDGCKLEQIGASRYRGRSKRESMSSGQMMLRIASHPDSMLRRPDGWSLDSLVFGREDTLSGRLTGNRNFWLENYAEFSEELWIVESLLKSIFTYKWFCPTEWG